MIKKVCKSLIYLGALFLSLVSILLLHELILMLGNELGQRANVLVGLLQQVRQTFVLLLVQKLSIAIFVLGHEQLHTLFFESLLFLLLDALGVRVPVDDRLGLFGHLGHARSMKVLEVLGMLHDGVQVLGMLLAFLALGFLFLLTFHFLGDACLAQRLTFTSFVRFRVDSCLESRVRSHTRYDLVAQLLRNFKHTINL